MGKQKNAISTVPFRTELLKAIQNPLGFFVLALLIVETSITIVITHAGLNESMRQWAFISLILCFVLVVLIVTALTWIVPKNLTYSEASHLRADRAAYGSETKPASKEVIDQARAVSVERRV